MFTVLLCQAALIAAGSSPHARAGFTFARICIYSTTAASLFCEGTDLATMACPAIATFTTAFFFVELLSTLAHCLARTLCTQFSLKASRARAPTSRFINDTIIGTHGLLQIAVGTCNIRVGHWTLVHSFSMATTVYAVQLGSVHAIGITEATGAARFANPWRLALADTLFWIKDSIHLAADLLI
jgi:hypothetical protein